MTERIRQHLHSITLDAAADQVQLPKMNVQPKAAGKSLEAVDRDTLGEVQHLELGVAGAMTSALALRCCLRTRYGQPVGEGRLVWACAARAGQPADGAVCSGGA